MAGHVRDGARPSSRSVVDAVVESALHADGGRRAGRDDDHVPHDHHQARPRLQSARGAGSLSEDPCASVLKRGKM